MSNSLRAKRYILLPANQIRTTADSNPKVSDFLVDLSREVARPGAVRLALRSASPNKSTKSVSVNVLDSIHGNGAKLVSLKEDEMADFRFSYPGLRIIPEKFYRRAFREEVLKKAATRSGSRVAAAAKTQIIIQDQEKNPLAGIYVVAFTDFDSRTGASGTTNKKGQVSLDLGSRKIDRIYVYPEHSFWGFFRKGFTIPAVYSISLKPIDTGYTDCLRHFYLTRSWQPLANKVRVGIIDTGFGPHKEVKITAGKNMVLNEDPADYADQEGHGTHVAGIIGAGGQLPGVANGVELYIYRVFPKGKSASNFDIMKAIDQAKNDQCDLVNMSLGEEGLDEGIVSSIKDAYSAGLICVAANGNDDRGPVNFPASYSLCIAVSAMGRKGCFPAGTVQTGIVKAPYGKDKNNFIADFSNIGPETDLVAPGVGIISTFPADLYAVMDGTSMACPAATGMAARLLSTRPDLLALPRDQARADEIQKFLSTAVKSLGFKANFEGKGMLFL
jgi:subtilisin